MAVSYKQVKKDINTLYGPEVDPKRGQRAASKNGPSLGIKERLAKCRDKITKRSEKKSEQEEAVEKESTSKQPQHRK